MISFAFTHTKSMVELADGLELLRQRLERLQGCPPLVVYADNVDQIEDFLRTGKVGPEQTSFKGFGEDLDVLYDPFHKLMNIAKSLPKKHELAKDFMRNLTNALFTKESGDLDAWTAYFDQCDKDGIRTSKNRDKALRERCRLFLPRIDNTEEQKETIRKLNDVYTLYEEKSLELLKNARKPFKALEFAIKEGKLGESPK